MKYLIIITLLFVSLGSFAQNDFQKKNVFRDTLQTPNIIQKSLDTSNYKIDVVDALGNHYKMYWPTFGSSSTGGVQTLSSQYTDASNSGTSETDLMSYTVPSGKLVNDGDRLEIEGWFTYAANANTKTLKFKFGSYVATIASSFVTSSGGSVKFRIVVTRTGATSQNIAYEFKPEFGTPTQGFSGGTETLSGTVVTKFTGTSGTASSDITQKTMAVTYYPVLAP